MDVATDAPPSSRRALAAQAVGVGLLAVLAGAMGWHAHTRPLDRGHLRLPVADLASASAELHALAEAGARRSLPDYVVVHHAGQLADHLDDTAGQLDRRTATPALEAQRLRALALLAQARRQAGELAEAPADRAVGARLAATAAGTQALQTALTGPAQ